MARLPDGDQPVTVMNKHALLWLPLAAAVAVEHWPNGRQVEAEPWRALRDVHLDVIPRTEAEQERVKAVTALPRDFSAPWPFEENAGGAQTVRARSTADAFSQPADNLTFEQELDFRVGNGMFRRIWVSA